MVQQIYFRFTTTFRIQATNIAHHLSIGYFGMHDIVNVGVLQIFCYLFCFTKHALHAMLYV